MSNRKRRSQRSGALPKTGAMVSRAYAPNPTLEKLLAMMPLGTKHWRTVLGALVKMHNYRHATKDKGVSLQTMRDRKSFLFSFFGELNRETRFHIDPRQLGNRHIEEMVSRWVDRGLATATIHNYLSNLRFFAEWINKPGMVRPPEHYVGSGSPHAHRQQVPTSDKSWSANNVDIAATIEQCSKQDAWVGLQLELCWRFALRPKEARHFRPHGAVVDRSAAIPADAAAFPGVEEFVRIAHGTKGGRPRDVPLVSDEQRDLLARLQLLVQVGGYVGRPGHTADQNRSRFYYVVRRHGIARDGLGVVAHGLRHQAANDRFEELADHPSPVRGGDGSGEGAQEARTMVARMLGHARERAAAFYLGSSRTKATAPDDSADKGVDEAGGDECNPA